MSLVSISSCPICNGTKFSVYQTCTDYTTSQEQFTLKKCSKCNFIFTDPRPDDGIIQRYYQSGKYISHTGGNKSLIDNIYIQARKITLRWKRALIKNYSDGNKILDVGCGTGEFLSEMKSHGSGIFTKKNGGENSQINLRYRR